MKFAFRSIPIDRVRYASVGLILFGSKFVNDNFIAMSVFQKRWTIFDYWTTLTSWIDFHNFAQADKVFYLTLLAASVPFVLVGIWLTFHRLRDAGLPLFLVFLFFVPVLNLLFFALLCVLPTRQMESEASLNSPPKWLSDSIPTSPFASAATAIAITLLFGLLISLFGTSVLKKYGVGLFVGLPFCLGLLSVLLDSAAEKRSKDRCLSVSGATMVLMGIFLFLFAMEGFICLAMAFPIAMGLGLLGGMVGYFIQSARFSTSNKGWVILIVVSFSPVVMGFESIRPLQTRLIPVKTQIEVMAPAEVVWQHVVSFSRLPEPTELIFRSGLAYPIEAEIEGTGVGAVRRCIFSTGEFVEPIRVWDAPRLLAFDVAEMPVPMRELTPYRHIHPAHLDGYFSTEKGQFLLTPNPNGSTSIEGTTWYRNHMWPAFYWNIWADMIVHKIHYRVLAHIKREAENAFSKI